jgi:hypothetical protein
MVGMQQPKVSISLDLGVGGGGGVVVTSYRCFLFIVNII